MTQDATASTQDLAWLRRTFQLAEEARALGRHPFSAVVVDGEGRVVSEAFNNSMPPEGDPTQHAEVRAAALAAKALSPAKLRSCTIYSNAEPCCMCAGAIYWCNVGRVVYALSEDSLLGLTGNHPENPTLSLPCRAVFAAGQHRIEVVGPLLEDEASAAHKDFWK